MIYYFFIVLSFIIWSSYGILIKFFNLNPFALIFYLSLYSLILIYFYIKLKKNISLKLKFKTFLLIIIASILLFGNTITYFYALKFTSITNTILSHYAAPVIAALFIPFFLNEKIEKITIVALIISFLGILLIFFPEGNLISGKNDIIGISFGLASAFCYAFLIIIAKYLLKEVDSLFLMFYENLISIGIIILFLPIIKYKLIVTKSILLLYLVMGIIHNFIAPLLYLEGLKKIKAQHAAILGYIEPVSAICMEIVFLKFLPKIGTLIGGILIILSGVMIINWNKNILK